jgi:hypothetical protein
MPRALKISSTNKRVVPRKKKNCEVCTKKLPITMPTTYNGNNIKVKVSIMEARILVDKENCLDLGKNLRIGNPEKPRISGLIIMTKISIGSIFCHPLKF